MGDRLTYGLERRSHLADMLGGDKWKVNVRLSFPAYNDSRSKDTRTTSHEEAHHANAET
jgi:hypothetical protein